jgi:hypothetical protein
MPVQRVTPTNRISNHCRFVVPAASMHADISGNTDSASAAGMTPYHPGEIGMTCILLKHGQEPKVRCNGLHLPALGERGPLHSRSTVTFRG